MDENNFFVSHILNIDYRFFYLIQPEKHSVLHLVLFHHSVTRALVKH